MSFKDPFSSKNENYLIKKYFGVMQLKLGKIVLRKILFAYLNQLLACKFHQCKIVTYLSKYASDKYDILYISGVQ